MCSHHRCARKNFSEISRGAADAKSYPRSKSEYRVTKDRNSRAIAGLSMGGSESLLDRTERSRQVCLDRSLQRRWHAGTSLKKIFPALDAKANEQIQVLWIACGTEDRLITVEPQSARMAEDERRAAHRHRDARDAYVDGLAEESVGVCAAAVPVGKFQRGGHARETSYGTLTLSRFPGGHIIHGGGALQFVPRKLAAFQRALQRFEKHNRK